MSISYAVFCLKKKIGAVMAGTAGASTMFMLDDPACAAVYTLSLHDALPICHLDGVGGGDVVAVVAGLCGVAVAVVEEGFSRVAVGSGAHGRLIRQIGRAHV